MKTERIAPHSPHRAPESPSSAPVAANLGTTIQKGSRRARYVVLLLLVFCAVPAGLVAQPPIFRPALGPSQSLEGFAKAAVNRSYPIEGIPFLDSFYFRFTGTDHHIGSIRVKPGSPVPEPSPQSSGPALGTIDIQYMDDSRRHEYFFNLAHHTLVGTSIQRRKTFDFCTGECTRPLIRPAGDQVFLITGFTFFFIGGRDRHIDRFGILENDGNVTVFFSDKSPSSSDTFKWELEYAYVPKDFVRRSGTVGGRNSGEFPGGDRRSIPDGPSVIRGFKLDFADTDHHLREVGVMTRPGSVEVFFGDKRPTERFDWTVRWAILRTPQQVFAIP